jgi:dihydrodipicolinate synthase/N-acetylneuraminate lyase
MPKISLLCRNAVTFSKSGAFDDDAYRHFLQRFVDANIGVYIGALEGHVMTRDELKRAYRIGVEVCKGKVPVNGNPPERHSPKEFLESVLDAVDAGVEIVNIYGPAGWHGYQPTDAELRAYFDSILSKVRHPVALAPLPIIGYTPKPELIAELCCKYRHVVAVNLAGMANDSYFLRIKNGLDRDVPINVPWPGSLNTLGLGAAGLLAVEANVIPKTFRRYVDLYESGNVEELSRVYADLMRFNQYVLTAWQHHTRWIKITLHILKLPGGEGGAREPYVMPEARALQTYTDGLLALKIPEIDELARTAGLL